jgi:hypothetical protein
MVNEHPSEEQQAQIKQVMDELLPLAEQMLREAVTDLVQRPDSQVLGPGEFATRDVVHRLGSQILEKSLAARKKKATKDPA